MPHITVKLWPGNDEERKQQLADHIVESAVEILGLREESFSVSFEEVTPQDWKEQVYLPDIVNKKDKLYKKPGYEM
ncbi:MAG: tautomerase family protein [Flavipsychrobacter sp.]